MKVTVLGCGSSGGVPLLGCRCAVCASDDPRNKRTRVSLLVESGGKKLLIDTSPDLRIQCLRHDVTEVDAVLYTHAHADHLHGIDDVRSLNYHRNAAIDMYANPVTIDEITKRFSYIFTPRRPDYGWYKPALTPHVICADNTAERIQIAGMDITVFPQRHGELTSLGFRFGDIAYSTDANGLPEASFAALEGTRIWIVDCLRREPSPTHAHLEMTLAWIARVKPERAILTHMSHDFEYHEFSAELPQGIEPAYDGMILGT